MKNTRPLPVLIVGAGVIGLSLAQALKKANIPFHVFERDATPTARGQGWAITLHWSLDFLPQLLPSDVIDRINAAQVDPANARDDKGNFLFLDLTDCSVKWKIPPNRRWRVDREKMRLALLEGVQDAVSWGCRVVGVENLDDGIGAKQGVEVILQDGTRRKGRILIGADGSNSAIRKILRPDDYLNKQLPVRFTGVRIALTSRQIGPLRNLDPLLFQGTYPPTGDYLWFSTLETPESNGTKDSDREVYVAQICMSWLVKSEEDEVAPTDEGRLANMKRRAEPFDPRLRDAVHTISIGTPVTEVKLADWACLEWNNRHGTVTLAGDAAHAMTMYRGEAANHGLLDALGLAAAVRKIYSGEANQEEAIDGYEKELRERTRPAVLLSRQACLDAHHWESLNEESAILRRRAIAGLERT